LICSEVLRLTEARSGARVCDPQHRDSVVECASALALSLWPSAHHVPRRSSAFTRFLTSL